ncbi:hypothetical protein RHMOL_Rhmol01G0343400 [Rhododendron molle]|uniref:Uncharacterized protein n=1 Tax=Rhododendron molle TaxID=49168 RepID=A0ACC0QA18_RHOML|nr:hypothetical protein RHMOL_Rhmol01G0343400 [Rhododendron molle]
MEEEEKIVKGDDDVELDATLEDLYMGGSLKVCEQCPNVKYEREGYFFIAVDGQVQALVGYEETIKHLDEHLVDISTKGVTKPKEVRKFKGILLDGRRVSISGPLALSCEALALRKACLMGKALHLSGIQVENDNKHLITLCVSELVPPWECRVIIQDIKTLATGLRLFILCVPREANCAAHWMASPF